MKIGLMGFEFASANKGCEALVYSFLSIIKDHLKKDDIIINFSGTPLGYVPDYFTDCNFINIYPKLKDYKLKYIRKLKECDIIFDATMGDSFSDIYSKSYYNHLIMNKRAAEKLCRKYILLPQTYGPFEFSTSVKKAQSVLKRAYRIYCRDEMSQRLLQDRFNIRNSLLASDMAFVLPYDKNMYSFSQKEKLGINISGLLYKGGFYKKNQFNLSIDYSGLIEKLIVNLSKRYEIHFIPHVIDLDKNAYDDDYKVCNMFHQKYPGTILAPVFDTPIQAKSYISNMSIFIGSRMHSTIAAFSSNVITIPVSYSRKFEGLFGSVNYPFVVNAREESTQSAYELIMNYVNDKETLSVVQQKSMLMINAKNVMFRESINNFLIKE